jgi:hypothetical protein
MRRNGGNTKTRVSPILGAARAKLPRQLCRSLSHNRNISHVRRESSLPIFDCHHLAARQGKQLLSPFMPAPE